MSVSSEITKRVNYFIWMGVNSLVGNLKTDTVTRRNIWKCIELFMHIRSALYQPFWNFISLQYERFQRNHDSTNKIPKCFFYNVHTLYPIKHFYDKRWNTFASHYVQKYIYRTLPLK